MSWRRGDSTRRDIDQQINLEGQMNALALVATTMRSSNSQRIRQETSKLKQVEDSNGLRWISLFSSFYNQSVTCNMYIYINLLSLNLSDVGLNAGPFQCAVRTSLIHA